ncbi:MAG: GAF domain-containing protein, partial [Leptolyngbyaceae cyanobacterium SU_3_3]|nr:GAF domain-containing protein [Leptolyngbyaceae cyanobacterium SU_3_3]
MHQCAGTRLWQESEINLLYQLCLELTVNLQQSEFLTRLNQQDDREKAIFKIIDRIRRSLDITTIFRTTTQEVRQMLNADRVMVYRFNPDWSGEIVAESVASGWTSLLQEQFNNPSLQGNVSDCSLQTLGNNLQSADTYLKETQGGIYARGESARVVNDIYQAGFSPCYLDSLEQFQARAYVIVPIIQDRKLWGLLAAYQNAGPRTWDKAEVALMTQLGTQMGVALQQAENLQQVKRQTEQLAKVAERERSISEVIEKIRTTLDIDTIFKTATQEVRQLLQADRVGVYRFEPDWSGEFVAESLTSGWVSLLQEQEDNPLLKDNISECSAKTLGSGSLKTTDTYLQDTKGGSYATGTKFRVVNDIDKAGFSACYLGILERYQAKAYIIVPIVQNNKLWGLLAAYQNSAPRQWENAEVMLMAQIGSQLGVALQQAEYLRQVQEQTQQLAKVAERERNFVRVIDQVGKSVIEKIRLSQDIETTFGQTTQQIRQLLRADRVSVYRFNPDWSGEFIAESAGSSWVKLVTPDHKTAWEDTHLQETQGGRYRNNETFAVSDIYQVGHHQCHVEILEQFQVKAYVIVPIFKGQRLWGLLAAYQNSAPRQWEESEVNLLAQIGAQLGVALQQTEFLGQIQRQTEREKTLARVSDRIRQSVDFSRQSLDISKIFQVTTQDVRQLMKVDRVAIYQFNPDWSGSFVAESVSSGWSRLVGTEIGTNVQDTYLRENQGGRYRNRESLAIDDIYKAGHDPCHVELLEK